MDVAEIRARICEDFQNNQKQLEIVFSQEKRMLLEAPAGCGKTKTIVGRISYLLASKQVVFPKKILALTFSVNAAYKLKNDVAKMLKDSKHVDGIVQVHNYHSFARSILRLYGYLLDSRLAEIDKFDNFGGDTLEQFTEANINVAIDELQPMIDFHTALKNSDSQYLQQHFEKYLADVINYCLPKKQITFNAILCFAIKILASNKQLRQYFQAMFSNVIFDEFQDTNYLMLWLLGWLCNDNSSLLFVGDPLQQIYGFIGSVDGIFDMVKLNYTLKPYELTENFRFKDNAEMLRLDNNIRAIAKNPATPSIASNANIELISCDSQESEANSIAYAVRFIIQENPHSKVAILVKARTQVEPVLNSLRTSGIDFFWALYTDGDPKYIKFHNFLLSCAKEHFAKSRSIGKNFYDFLKRKVDSEYSEKNDLILSLTTLLEKFFWFLDNECQYLTQEDKRDFILDVFSNHGLKQYIEYVSSQVTVSTIHAAKGLEWDFVFLPDMEKDNFPSYYGLCASCASNPRYEEIDSCSLEIIQMYQTNDLPKKFLQELSVFYVAVTRARKKVYFSKSQYSHNGRYKPMSCFLTLAGIEITENTSFTQESEQADDLDGLPF